jgi:hypothetical protein
LIRGWRLGQRLALQAIMKIRHALLALVATVVLTAVITPLGAFFLISLAVLLVPAVPIVAVLTLAALLRSPHRTENGRSARPLPPSSTTPIYAGL